MKVVAGAGCGKTLILVEYGRTWPWRGLYLAFNRSIADEAGRKFPKSIETRTAHSFAYRALDIGKRGKVIPKLRFEHLQPFNNVINPVRGIADNKVRGAILIFYAYQAGPGNWAIWEPQGEPGNSGRALLWLYFAIVAQLNWSSRGVKGAIIDFTAQVARDFPMQWQADIATATGW